MSESTPHTEENNNQKEEAFSIKVTVYAKGLFAGIGIQALDADLLKLESEDSELGEKLKQKILNQAHQVLSDKGVKEVKEDALQEAVEEFIVRVQDANTQMVARKVAEGQAPDPGEDGRIEYELNPDNLPRNRLEDVPPNSKKRWFHLVEKGQTLARAIPAQPASAGSDVRGEAVEPSEEVKEPALTSILGTNTSIQNDCLISDIDGMYEENVDGRIRVVPEVVVDEVGAETGSLPEAGTSKANMLVRQDIKSRYRVATSETVFVGLGQNGNVENNSIVEANNLVVNGIVKGVFKEPSTTSNPHTLQVKEIFAAKAIDGRHIMANDILVYEDSLFGLLDADQAIRVGGNITGGCVICRSELAVCGNLGTQEGGSRTRVLIPQQGEPSRSQKRIVSALAQQTKTISEFKAKLEEMEASSAKRAKSDAYWASLSAGDLEKPKNPMQINTLRQFRDALNETKQLERSIAAAQRALNELKNQAEDEAQEAATAEVVIKVEGWTYLDAEFEVTLGVGEDDLEQVVTYAVAGKRYRNHTLLELKSELTKQASDYLEAEQARVGERKQAIEQMFEGAEKRPSGPQIVHKQFELSFEWSGDDTQQVPPELRMATTAFVTSEDPQTLVIRTITSVREELERIQLKISQDGPKAQVLVEPGSNVEWRDREDVREMLENLYAHGLSAWDLLQGKTLEDEGLI